jgi:hypothetical protein
MSDNNNNKVNHELMAKLEEALAPYPEAIAFALDYRELVHAIDDLIDQPNRPTSEEILRMAALAGKTYSQPFWLRYGGILHITEQLVNNTYADSVIWERGDNIENRNSSDTLRHSGLDMFYAVVYITLGREKLREFSAPFREQCHNIQRNDPLIPKEEVHANF